MKKFFNKFIIILLFSIACIFLANGNVHATDISDTVEFDTLIGHHASFSRSEVLSFSFNSSDNAFFILGYASGEFSNDIVRFVTFYNSSDFKIGYYPAVNGQGFYLYPSSPITFSYIDYNYNDTSSCFEYKTRSYTNIDNSNRYYWWITSPSHILYSDSDIYTISSISSDYNKCTFSDDIFYNSSLSSSSDSGTSERGTDDTDNSNTSGDTTGDGEDSESDNTSWLDTLWNWFSNLSDKIGNISNSVGEKISEIFSPLWDFITNILSWLNPFSENFILLKLWEFLSDILSYLNPFSDNFFGNILVEKIGTLLKNIFIPDEDYFSNKIADLKSNLNNKIGYQDYIDTLQNIENVQESNIGDIYLNNYKINGVEISSKFINFENILKYRNLWFGIVRGIFYISLLIFDINYIYKLIRGNKLFESGE